jgi:hypothetical protein
LVVSVTSEDWQLRAAVALASGTDDQQADKRLRLLLAIGEAAMGGPVLAARAEEIERAVMYE